MSRLSSHDASFLYTETANGPMHSISFTVINGIITADELIAYYEPRLYQVPRLRQRVMFVPFNMAHPRWVDDPDFDIRNHVVAQDVPDGATIEDAVEVGLQLGEPLLDRKRPLWKVFVFSGVEDKTLLVQMTHHAFADGATMVAMLIALTDRGPEPTPVDPPPPWKPARLPTSEQLMAEALTEQATSFASSMGNTFRLPDFDRETMTKTTAFLARMARPVIQAPWNAGLVGPKRCYMKLTYELEDFKRIRKALGGTINDVVVAISVEAMARYMKGKGEVTDNQYLRIMCPVDVRPAGEDALSSGNNQVSGMFPILSAWPKSMSARYVEVKHEMQGVKDRAEAETVHQLQTSLPNFPPVMMAPSQVVGTPLDPLQNVQQLPQTAVSGTGFRPQQFGFNFTVTNVPGPTWTMYVLGHEVESSVGTLMLGGNLGMGIGVSSFNGKVFFGITSDARLLPDIEKVRDLVAQTFDELTAEAGAVEG